MQMEQMKLSVETRNALFLPTNACEISKLTSQTGLKLDQKLKMSQSPWLHRSR